MGSNDKSGSKCVVCAASPASFRCRQCRAQYCSGACFKRHQLSLQEATLLAAEAAAAPAGTQTETPPGELSASFPYLCEVILAAQQPAKERELKRLRTEAEADVFSDVSREKATALAGSPRSRTTESEGASPALPADVRSCSAEGQKEEEKVRETGESEEAAPPASTSSATAAAGGALEEVGADADAVYILQEAHLRALANDPNVRGALRSPSLQKLIRTIDASRSRLDALDAAQYNNADFKRFCNDVIRAIAKVEGR